MHRDNGLFPILLFLFVGEGGVGTVGVRCTILFRSTAVSHTWTLDRPIMEYPNNPST
jgi:hypothetical protein